MLKFLCAIPMVVALMPMIASAAGFNCRFASTVVEKMICDDPELSRMDEAVVAIYEAKIKSAANRDEIVNDQYGWRTGIRDKCTSLDCLRGAYRSRLAVLNGPVPQPTRPPTDAQREQMQRSKDGLALVRSDMRSWLDVVSVLAAANSCKIIKDIEVEAPAVKIAVIYQNMLADNGVSEPVNIRAEIQAAAKKGTDAARDPGFCDRAFGQPEDRARIRKLANDLIASMH